MLVGVNRGSITLVACLLSLTLVLAIEHYAHSGFKQVEFSPIFLHQIKSENPELILIGNSMLGENIDKGIFAEELQKALGRRVRFSIISRGGIHTAWQYLVIKNQVLPSGIKNVPIVLIDFEDYYTRPMATTEGGGQPEFKTKQMMNGPEPVFLNKIGANSVYYGRGAPYLFHNRYQLKTELLGTIVIRTLERVGLRTKRPSKQATKYDRALGGILRQTFREKKFRSGELTSTYTYSREKKEVETKESFELVAEKSFLPEIIKLAEDYKLALVISNSNPDMVYYKPYHKRYAPRLEQYLTERGVTLIDLNSRKELNRRGLMHDSRHYDRGFARSLNTRILAEELVKRGIVK